MEIEETVDKTIRSIVALMGRSIFLQAISFIAFFLLGIFLEPHALGVFIVVSALMKIFTLFTDVGLGAALIQQHDEPTKIDLSTAFVIQTTLVVAVALAGFLLTPFVVSYAHLGPDSTFLYHVLLFTLIISSLKTIPSILLERKLAFDKQIIPQIVESLVFNGLVVYLAFRGLEVASYSWAILASALIGLPIYYLISPWHISFGFSKQLAKKLFSYGIFFQGKSTLAVLKDDLLIFVVSGIVGTSGIGFWGWAQRWSYFPFRFTVDSITKVTFPAYSRIQHNKDALRVGIEKSLLGTSLILFPLLVLMITHIERFIYLIPRYAKWEPSMPSFYLLCLTAGISALSNILINALDATGRVKTTLGLMVFWVIATWLLTLGFVAQIGFTGIALAAFIVSLTIVLTVYLVKKVVTFNFLKNIWQALVGSLVMAIIIVPVARVLPNNFITITLTVIIGCVVYGTVLWLIARNELSHNIKIVISAFKKPAEIEKPDTEMYD